MEPPHLQSDPWALGQGDPHHVSGCFSSRPFALDDLDDYEKHFTVMNYDPNVVLKQVGLLGCGEVRADRPVPSSVFEGDF